MRRVLLLGIVTCAVFAIGQGPHFAGSAPAAAQPTERVEFREAPPSCAQAIKDLHLEGQAVNCEEPPPPTYDPPQMHGPYRLIAPTYVGPLTYRDDPAPAFPVGVVSEDREVVQRSPLYRPPAWLPQGYAPETLMTGDTGSEDALGALYSGPGEPVWITWVRRYTRPIDVILPNPDSVLMFEPVTVDGKPGILWYPKTGSSVASGLTTSLSYMEGDVEITVMGEELDPETAKGIALSIACGAACMPSGPSGLGVGDASQAQSADSSPSPAGSGGDTLTTVPPTEYRILAGLATASDTVNVSYQDDPNNPYWHGFSYGEAALDLTDPDGNTDQRWVYFLTYQYSGTAWLTATTVDHHNPPNPSGTHCTGRDVLLRVYGGLDEAVGHLTYVHLTNQRPAGDAWAINGTQGGWTVRTLGQPVTWQESGCDFHGTHLHQGLKLPSSLMTYNTALPNPGAVINPVSDYDNNWMFNAVLAGDSDGDGCSDSQEEAMGFNPQNRWDVYDVPVPANADPTPNGTRNRAMNLQDVVGVLRYVGTADNGPSNGKVDYDSDKNGDAIEDGVDYDRSPSPPPSPPYDAGPPSSAVNLQDVVVVLKQVGLDCSGPPSAGGEDGLDGASGSGTLSSAPNAMAVDAIPGGSINQWRWWLGGSPFDIDVVVTAAGESYAAYDLALSYDDQILEFVPTADRDGDTVLESWGYTGLGGMGLKATVSRSDLDGDTVLEKLVGGSALSSGTTTATGAVVTGRFRCVGNGVSPLHLVTPAEAVLSTTTIDDNAAAIDTSLADANVWCSGIQ